MNENSGFIYIVEALNQNTYKIGKANILEKRLSALQTGNFCELKLFHSFQSENVHRAEKALQDIFAEKKVRGEWYRLSSIDLAFISQISGFNTSFIWNNIPVTLSSDKSPLLDLFSVTIEDMVTSTGELKDITLTETDIRKFLERAWRRQEKNKNGLSSRSWVRTPNKKVLPEHYNAMIKLLMQNGLILDRKHRYSGKLALSPAECLSVIKINLQ